MSQPKTVVKRRDMLGGSSEAAVDTISGFIGGAAKGPELMQVPLRSITVLPQFRRDFPSGSHAALVENVREYGVIEPVLVNRLPDSDKYQLIAGERRYRAARALAEEGGEVGERFASIPALAYDDLPVEKVREIQLSENILREDLNEIDETLALLDLLSVRLGKSAKEVRSLLVRMEKESRGAARQGQVDAEAVKAVEELFRTFSKLGWTTFVKKRLDLLSMPQDVERAFREGRVKMSLALLLMRLPDSMRTKYIDLAERGMSKEELQGVVQSVTRKPTAAQPKAVQLAVSVKKRLTPKRFVKLSDEKRKQVQELLEQVNSLLESEDDAPAAAPAKEAAPMDAAPVEVTEENSGLN